MEDAVRQQLIEQLKPIVNEPEFDKIFAMLTADMSGPKRFQLKTELRDLAAPCNRQVDLRKRVIGDVQAYTHRGQIHYMDNVAIQIFEEGLDRYNGIFTEDTYRSIYQAENNIRVMQERERELALYAQQQGLSSNEVTAYSEQIHKSVTELQQDQSVDVPYFTFGRYVTRREERMNYAASVALHIGSKVFDAVTSDVSVSGIRVRLKTAQDVILPTKLERGLAILVKLTGFTQEFSLNLSDGVWYTLMGTEKLPQGTYLRLKRRLDQPDDNFDAFLSKFIAGYKNRYKVNVDNIFEGLVSKANEQLYLPRMSGVPLFFKRVEKRMFPQFALESKMNRAVLDSWLDETGACVVAGLFSGKRLTKFLRACQQQPQSIATCVIYSFQVLRNGRVYFYSALDSELTTPDQKRLFLAYASRRADFRVYRFSFTPLDIGKAWIPSTIPQDVVTSHDLGVRPPTPEVMKQLEGLTHVGLLTDITPVPDPYHHYEYERDELAALTEFAHPRKGLLPLQRASFEVTDVRSESRYNYRTQMRLEAHGEGQLGITRDISTSGLQVEIERSMGIVAGDVVYISLPQLAKNYTSFDLRKIPYQVMHTSAGETRLHLRVTDEKDHLGKRFFNYLLSSRQRAFKAYEQTGTLSGLELCLRNLYCNALMSLPLFLSKASSKKIRVQRAGLSRLNETLKQYCLEVSSSNTLNLQPLLSEAFLHEVIEPAWLELEPNTSPWRTTLIVRRSVENNILRTRRLRLATHMSAEQMNEAKAFIQHNSGEAEVYALQFDLVRTGQPDTEFIADELNYLQQYSGHRAEAVEEEMWQVVGFIDVTLVTQEVLLRFQQENIG